MNSPSVFDNSVAEVTVLLGQYSELVNQHGVKSEEAKNFLAENVSNEEFVQLAKGVVFLREKFDLLRSEATGHG